MNESSLASRSPHGAGTPRLFGGLTGAWRSLRFSALLLVMVASPATYSTENRRRLATQICLTCNQTVPAFTLLSALLSLVLVHRSRRGESRQDWQRAEIRERSPERNS